MLEFFTRVQMGDLSNKQIKSEVFSACQEKMSDKGIILSHGLNYKAVSMTGK